MGFQTHNYNYIYQTKAKGCYYCRQIFAKISRHRARFWDGKRVCNPCYLQLDRGVKLNISGWNLKGVKFTQAVKKEMPPIICKLCKKEKLYPIVFKKKFGKVLSKKYPHFCKECSVKFKKMVENDPKRQ